MLTVALAAGLTVWSLLVAGLMFTGIAMLAEGHGPEKFVGGVALSLGVFLLALVVVWGAA